MRKNIHKRFLYKTLSHIRLALFAVLKFIKKKMNIKIVKSFDLSFFRNTLHSSFDVVIYYVHNITNLLYHISQL